MELVDTFSYVLVTVLTVGGIILAITTYFRSKKKTSREDFESEQLLYVVPEELAKLPDDQYVVLRKQYLMTKIGRTRADYIIISTHGIFCLEYTIAKGRVYGEKYVQKWEVSTLAGFGQKRITSPLWRANVNIVTLREMFPELKDIPAYPMAVFPDNTQFSDELSMYNFVEDEEEIEYVDDEDFIEEEDNEDDYIELDDSVFVGCLGVALEFIQYHQDDALSLEQVKSIAKKIQANTDKLKDWEDDEDEDDDSIPLLPDEYRSFSLDYQEPIAKEDKKHDRKK